MEGFQLWVNLPAKDKMCEPRYQDISPDKIPVAEDDAKQVKARVIAGTCLGKSAVIETKTPITVLDIQLQPGATLVQPLTESYRGFVLRSHSRCFLSLSPSPSLSLARLLFLSLLLSVSPT